jgi:hypothetical protein
MPMWCTVRTYPRFSVEGPVDYLGPAFIGKGVVRNLSREGLRLVGHHTAVPGMKIAMLILLPGSPVKVKEAVVRWVRGREFGAKIVEIEPRESARLGLFVTKLVQRHFSHHSLFT